jgi:hypothetical protein
MRLTLLISAIASVSFAATLAFAPAIAQAGERLAFGKAELTRVSVRQEQIVEGPECRSPLQVILIALSNKDCK